MSKRSTGREAWLSDYQNALVQAAGIAYILGFSDHAKILHELSCQAMGIDTEAKTRYNVSKKQEEKKMKKYEYGFYAESGEFFEIREYGFDDGKKYYVVADSAENAYSEFVGALDEEYCGEEMTVREIPTGHDMTNYIKL